MASQHVTCWCIVNVCVLSGSTNPDAIRIVICPAGPRIFNVEHRIIASLPPAFKLIRVPLVGF
jgi:hypothetical protein